MSFRAGDVIARLRPKRRCDFCKRPFSAGEQPHELRVEAVDRVFLVHGRCVDRYWDVVEGDDVPTR